MDELPNEILVILFEFLSEADKRKLSVCSLLFCELYRKFFTLLPYKLETSRGEFSCDKIIRWKSWFGFEYFQANEKFFDFLGPYPSLLINLNDSINLTIEFKKDIVNFDTSYHFPKLDQFSDFKITIIETHNCKLKFTQTHSDTYFVDGCSLDELHSIQKEPCVMCKNKREAERRYWKTKELRIHNYRIQNDSIYAAKYGKFRKIPERF
jgi:hypothetical protein